MSSDAESKLQPTLVGETLTLRPLQTQDFEALYAVASDPLIWEQHPEPTRWQRPVFSAFFEAAIRSGGAFIVVENATGDVLGSSRFYDWDPATHEVTIGYTFLARSHWGGAMNAEMKRLMLDHAFRWARIVWFVVGKNNQRSRKAMEKIGGVLARETRKETNGVVQESVWFKIERRD